MKRQSPTPWTAANLRHLRKLAKQGYSTPDIARIMGRGQRTVRQAADWYGIPLNLIRPRIQWTPEMDNVVRAHFPDTRTADLATKMAVTVGRKRKGCSVGTQFKPGHATWNKGIKGSTGHHPNSVRTQFKPGQLSGKAMYNYKPIGSLRISKDGLLERKMRDDGPSQSRWESVARLVWEAAHGPIQKRHVVRFKPGMHTTEEHLITPDRLECISQAENLRRNSRHHNYGPEMNQLIQLRGAMTRRINTLEKKLNEHHR